MIVVRLIWLAVLTLALPMWVGHCFAAVDKPHKNVVFLWISGQMLLWAGFQVICVPVILLEGHFRHVMIGYSVYLLVLLVLATVFWFRNPRGLRPVRQEKTAKSEKTEVLLWVIFAVLLLIQLVLAVVMVYGDGDDAYYVAISTAAQESGKMYQKIPYTGMNTELDVRHGLAPFPIWIAWLDLHGSGGQNIAAGGADLYDIWRILSAGKQDPVFRAIGSAVSDLHGSAGNVRRLFFFYRGEFHDRKKQTGKGGFGKYFDPDDLLPAALAVPQTAGGEKDHSRILDAVGSGDDFLLSGKYHGSVAGLYADGSGRDLRSCLL